MNKKLLVLKERFYNFKALALISNTFNYTLQKEKNKKLKNVFKDKNTIGE